MGWCGTRRWRSGPLCEPCAWGAGRPRGAARPGDRRAGGQPATLGRAASGGLTGGRASAAQAASPHPRPSSVPVGSWASAPQNWDGDRVDRMWGTWSRCAGQEEWGLPAALLHFNVLYHPCLISISLPVYTVSAIHGGSKLRVKYTHAHERAPIQHACITHTYTPAHPMCACTDTCTHGCTCMAI